MKCVYKVLYNYIMRKILKMFTIFILVFVLLFATTIFACCVSNDQSSPKKPTEQKPTEQPSEEKLTSVVRFADIPQGVDRYNEAVVKVGQTELPMYNVKVNNTHSWQANDGSSRDNCGVGYFSLVGKVVVTINRAEMTSCVVRPLSSAVDVSCENGVATFTLTSSGNYSVEPNGDPTKALFLFVSDGNAEETAPQTANVIRFTKGLHTAQNNSLINSSNVVDLSSNTTVILDEGAVVRAKFNAYQKDNITICGRGVIDGSAFVRNVSSGQVTVPLDFNYCNNITFKDFSVLDPAGWCVNWYFCTNSKIDNIKIISSRANGDGISLQSCSYINVSSCFVRTWDDSLVVKNYPHWSNRSNQGATNNITFENITLWTDLAQSMEIGYETVGKKLCDVTFRNITVLHNFHKPVISIHNSNNADVKNVLYDGITVEDASMGCGDAGGNNQLIEIATEYSSTWSNVQATTELGSIDGVTIRNVTVLGGNAVIPIRVVGSVDPRSGYGSTEHTTTNVTLENIWLSGRKILKNYAYFTTNPYAQSTIKEGESAFVVPFVRSQSAETVAKYGDKLQVTVL